MPYLTETDFNAPSGELNRAITKLFVAFKDAVSLERGLTKLLAKYEHDQKPRYATFNDIVGALECAYMEYQRRRGNMAPTEEIYLAVQRVKWAYYDTIVAPYEDKKAKEHGDIYASC